MLKCNIEISPISNFLFIVTYLHAAIIKWCLTYLNLWTTSLMNKQLLWFYFIIIFFLFDSVTSERERLKCPHENIKCLHAQHLIDYFAEKRRLARKNIVKWSLFNGAFQEEINYSQSSSIPKYIHKKTRFLRIESSECIYGEKSFVSLKFILYLFSKSRF